MKLLQIVAVFMMFEGLVAAAPGNGRIPLGQRVYVDTGNLWEPLKILPRTPGVEGILDPNIDIDAPQKAVAAQPQPREPAKPKTPSTMVFKKVDIQGRLSQPRVSFGRTRLQVGRVDEQPPKSRYERIFAVPRGDL